MKYLTVFIIFCMFLSCKSNKKTGEIFPSFDILLADSSTHINTGKIEGGAPIALLYFSPDCEHCQQETKDIIQHMDALKKTKFYFVTNDSYDRLKIFREYYKIDKYPNIILGMDEQFFLLRHFKGISPPYIVLYDRDKVQQFSHQGELAVDTLISCVNKL